VLALAERFLEVVSYEFSEQEFTLFMEVFQQNTALQLRELWTVVSVLKLVLLEQIAGRGKRLLSDPMMTRRVWYLVRSLRIMGKRPGRMSSAAMVIDRTAGPGRRLPRMDFVPRFYQPGIKYRIPIVQRWLRCSRGFGREASHAQRAAY
jgi:hypothetical protein